MIKQDITGSQNGWGWKGSLEISGCTLLQMQTHLERIPRTMSRELTFGYLQAGICHKSRGQPVLVVSYPHSEKVSPDVHREHPVFHFVPTASGPGTGHYWKEPGSTFTPSLQIFIYAGKSPAELSLLQTDQSQLSQPYPTGEMLQSLRHVCDPFPGLSPVCPYFCFTGESRTGHSTSDVPHQCWMKCWCGLPGLPWPAGNAIPKAELPFLHGQTHLLAHAQPSTVSVQLGGTQERLVHEAQRGGNTVRIALSWTTVWEGRWPGAGRRGWWSTAKGDGPSADRGRHCNDIVDFTHQRHSRQIW